MKKKLFLMIITCILIVFTLTGCINKKAISGENFKSLTKNAGYDITIATDQFSSYPQVKEAILAKHQKGYKLEFYVLTDKEEAIKMFNTNKSIFESYKENISTESNVNIGNHSSYSLTSGGYYMYVSRIDNTLIYVRINDTFKDEVKAFIKELGY